MKNIHVLSVDKPTLDGVKIYITDDEKIKECDWVITPTNDIIQWAKVFQPIGKKIILTTDQYLIRNGVQEIDDEFLEWFVNNPSCEEVEVEKIQYNPVFDEDDLSYDGMTAFYNYKIIIPKEEPKQETLEEAAEKYQEDITDAWSINEHCKSSFIDGAKWQQEQEKNNYSEEDLKYAYEQGKLYSHICYSRTFENVLEIIKIKNK
jgi:hypothetical protein